MGSLIREIRKRKGQTLAQVAEAVGTDAGNMSRIENGRQKASLAMAAKLASHFDYEITEMQILYPERFQDAA